MMDDINPCRPAPEWAVLKNKRCLIVNEIDEDEARLMGTFQGVNLYIVLPENRLYLEAFVIEVVQDGLSFLRLKHEYLGTREASNLV